MVGYAERRIDAGGRWYSPRGIEASSSARAWKSSGRRRASLARAHALDAPVEVLPFLVDEGFAQQRAEPPHVVAQRLR